MFAVPLPVTVPEPAPIYVLSCCKVPYLALFPTLNIKLSVLAKVSVVPSAADNIMLLADV